MPTRCLVLIVLFVQLSASVYAARKPDSRHSLSVIPATRNLLRH